MNLNKFLEKYDSFLNIYLISISVAIKYSIDIKIVLPLVLDNLNYDYSIFNQSIKNLSLKDIKIIMKKMNLRISGNKNELLSKLEDNLKNIRILINQEAK